MAISLSPSNIDLLRREADRAAGRMVRQFRLPPDARDDLRQDLLVDLIVRLKAFDPARGTLGAFAGTVIGHQAGKLANRIRRERTVFVPVSLDDPLADADCATLGDAISEDDGYAALLGQPTDHFAAVERRLDLDWALGFLPRSAIGLCADLIHRTPTELSHDGAVSRASLYRQIHEIRLCLMASGLLATA
jgi:Sigma-70 region 2